MYIIIVVVLVTTGRRVLADSIPLLVIAAFDLINKTLCTDTVRSYSATVCNTYLCGCIITIGNCILINLD